MSNHPVQEAAKHVTDATAGLVTIGAFMEFLPPLAALFTIIWTGLRIFEWFETRAIRREIKRKKCEIEEKGP